MEYISADGLPFTPASHEDPTTPGVLKRVIATADQFQRGHIQMLNWARLPGHSAFRKHLHEDMQEVFVLVSGQVEMTNGQQTFVMQPGDTVMVQAREPHVMKNLLPTDAEYIVFGISSEQGGKTIVLS